MGRVERFRSFFFVRKTEREIIFGMHTFVASNVADDDDFSVQSSAKIFTNRFQASSHLLHPSDVMQSKKKREIETFFSTTAKI